MRQPLEDGQVTISRAAGSLTFPSKMHAGGRPQSLPLRLPTAIVKESAAARRERSRQYRQRISGPLLDRIDLHVEVPRVDYRELSGKSGAEGEISETIRARVESCREVQLQRFVEHPDVTTNSIMTPQLVRLHCQLGSRGDALLERAMTDLNFSARAHDRILKVARTLADLEGDSDIHSHHLLEAIQYRTLDRNLWA